MDRISDFCTRIRNAAMARHVKVDIPHSKLQEGVAEQLKSHGYIRGYRVAREGAQQGLIRIYLKYKKKEQPAITHIERVSKPSKRVYVSVENIPNVCSGFGLVILSTNKGVVGGRKAKDLRVGGEILCQVW